MNRGRVRARPGDLRTLGYPPLLSSLASDTSPKTDTFAPCMSEYSGLKRQSGSIKSTEEIAYGRTRRLLQEG